MKLYFRHTQQSVYEAHNIIAFQSEFCITFIHSLCGLKAVTEHGTGAAYNFHSRNNVITNSS
jgi:hypothetical protein